MPDIDELHVVKIWTKPAFREPAFREQDVGLDVTSYLPAEINVIQTSSIQSIDEPRCTCASRFFVSALTSRQCIFGAGLCRRILVAHFAILIAMPLSILRFSRL